MNGAFPPSSNDTFFIVVDDCAMRSLPISVDPVNEILRTSGFVVSSPPISVAEPVTTLKTPPGMPACSPRYARARAENGVWDAGFATTVQPAASAGPTLRVIMAMGKLHGVMQATTPTGCLITM